MGVRKNYRNLTASERQRLVDALKALKANGTVDRFADLHQHHFDMGIHRSSHFLPWHREMLLRFEAELKKVDPRVDLPYWDSSVDRNTSDPLWDQAFMGQFDAAWKLNRALGSGPLPTVQQVQNNQQRTDYDTFWRELEHPIHNWPHVWVAGVMAQRDSPGDPIFYLHHAWIDLLWATWQAAHPGVPFVASGPGVGLNDPLMEWPSRTPADVLDHHALGYAYDVEPVPTGPGASGDDMQPGEVLTPGQGITSANGRYTFVYQADGNLVLYGPAGAMWASGTDGRPVGVAIMQGDGNLVIYGPGGLYVWDSGSHGNPGSRLVVQDDGNVVIYRPDGTPAWDTGTWQP
jgi:tyrosinase